MRLGIKYKGKPVPLWADESFWNTPKEEIGAVTGGCGPGRLGDWLIPDTVWFLSIGRACRIHDWDYHIGTNKAMADIRFWHNMDRIIMACTKWNWLKTLRLRRAKLYYLAVKNVGDYAYAKDENNLEVNVI